MLAGFYLGENWHLVENYAGIFQWIVIVVVILLLAWWVINRVRSIRTRRRADGRHEIVEDEVAESD